MKIVACGLMAALLVGGISCTLPVSKFEARNVKISPKGERIEVVGKDGTTIEGEFLFDDGKEIFLLAKEPEHPALALGIAREDVGSIKVKGQRNASWIPYVIGLQLIPAVLLGAAAESVNKGTFGSVAGQLSVYGAVTGLLFLLGTKPAPELKGAIRAEQLDAFRKYARYPFVPGEELKQKILESLK